MDAVARMFYRTFIITLLSFCCHAGSDRENPSMDWMPADIDWESATKIRIELMDHYYQPEDLELRKGQPYRVVFDNISKHTTHDLFELELFHSVVLEKLVAQNVTIVTPHIHSFKVKPGDSVELYFVPTKPGDYSVYCTIPGHREEGMEGLITVRD